MNARLKRQKLAGTGLATLAAALLTVGLQSLKAASANPADILKYE